MPVIRAEKLKRIASEMFEASGTPHDEAEIVAEHLVRANLFGVDSHGFQRVLYYLAVMGEGKIKPGAETRIVAETVSTGVLDGNWNFGQITGKKAMELAINKARSTGIGMTTIHNFFHTGRLGEYSEMAMAQDMVGIALGSDNKLGLNVVAYGGMEPVISTNPMAIAVPTHRERPFLLDMATSAVAGGKISFYLAEGKPVPEGWILDSEGRPTTNPADFRPPLTEFAKHTAKGLPMKRGALLPFGGYKGFDLGVAVGILGSFLSKFGANAEAGFIFIAIDISTFSPVEGFKNNVDRLIRRIKSSKRKPGVAEILVAGDPELNAYGERIKAGISIPDQTWKEVRETAQVLGVDIDLILTSEDDEPVRWIKWDAR